jgi:hypothetical protein
MKTQDVFEVAEVAQGKDGTWTVLGRAYEDLKIGDLVYPLAHDARDGAEQTPFEIVGIVTYGVEMAFLSRALTGQLTIRSPRGKRLKAPMMLVRQAPMVAEATTSADKQEALS